MPRIKAVLAGRHPAASLSRNNGGKPLTPVENKQRRKRSEAQGCPCGAARRSYAAPGRRWGCSGTALIGRQKFTCRNQEMRIQGGLEGQPAQACSAPAAWLLLFWVDLLKNIWPLGPAKLLDARSSQRATPPSFFLLSSCRWHLSPRSHTLSSSVRRCEGVAVFGRHSSSLHL